MKNYSKMFVCILALFFSIPKLFSDQLITLFLKPYPVVSPQAAAQKLGPKLNQVGKLANHQTKNNLPSSVAGIFATYGGWLTISDLNGEISFPRKHTQPFLYVLITQRLVPIIMAGNTIHHWETIEGVPAKMYRMEQKWDSDSKLNFWDITQEPLPLDNRVPLESLALFADPKYIYVPLGINTFKESPHLILPDIYVKKGLNLTEDALFILNLSHYFGGIIPLYKKENVRYSRQLTY